MVTTIASRPRMRLPRPMAAHESRAGDIVLFLGIALSAFSVSFSGQIPYGEILLLATLPFFFFTAREKIFREDHLLLYLLMGLWLVSQIITDIYVNAPAAARLKGVARVVFFALDLAALSALIGTSVRRIRIFLWGFIAFSLFGLHSLGSFADMWKFDLGPLSSTALLFLASPLYIKGRYQLVILIVLAMAAANLHYGVRSQVLINLATALLLLPIFPKTSHANLGFLGNRAARIALLLLLGVTAAWFSQKVIGWAASAGLYNEAEESKFQVQSAGKYGVIFGGRPEGPVAIQAIIDSPILGHGSYAVDPKYEILLQDYRYQYGYSDSDDPEDLEDPGIPTHSHLTMSWVEGGVLASFFWFYMLRLIGRSIIRLTEINHPLTPVYLFLLCQLCWDILFSPFGETRRLTEAFMIVIMLNVLRSKPSQEQQSGKPFRKPRGELRQKQIWRPGLSRFTVGLRRPW